MGDVGHKLEWLLKGESEHIKEWQRKERSRKRHHCDDKEELQRAAERVDALRRVRPKLDRPVSIEQYNDLVRLHYHHQALKWKEHTKGHVLGKVLPRLPDRFLHKDYDIFGCDKSAYEFFNGAVDDDVPLGRWVKRMLNVGSLITDVNFMDRPGWRAWPISSRSVCAEDACTYLRAINIEDADSQERLIPSMLAYLQCNRLTTTRRTVFVTGCKEFYDRVLLSKATLQLLVDAFMLWGCVLTRSVYLVDRVWYVSPDQVVPSLADEVCVVENKIRCPEGWLTHPGSPWMRPGEPCMRRQMKSAFLPDEV